MTAWKRFSTMVLMACAAAWGAMPSMAHGDFVITLQENSGASTTYDWTTTSPTVTGVTYTTFGTQKEITFTNFTFGDFTLGGTASLTNQPGTPSLAFINTDITALNNGGSSNKLTVTVSATNFTAPASPPPLQLQSTASGTVTSGSISGTFNSYADFNDGQSTTAGPGVTGTGQLGFSTTTSYSNTALPVGFNGSTYSLTSVGVYNFSAGGETEDIGRTSVIPTPAPAGLVLSLTGLPLLAFGVWLRRRAKVEHAYVHESACVA